MRRQKDFFKLQHQLSEAKAAKQTKQTRRATTKTTTAATAKPLPPLAVHYSISIQLLLLLLLLSHSRGLNLSSNKSLHCLCVYIIFIHCLSVPVLASSPCLCPASRRVDTLRAMFINKAQRQESPKSMLRLFFVSPHTAKSNNERKRKGDKTLRESAKMTSDSASPDAAKLAKPSDR